MLCVLLAACGSQPQGPVVWWHDYEGGTIAKDRPPPPGDADPYPNFAQVPPRATPIAAKARNLQMANLTETRDLSLAGAAASPLPVLATPAPAKAAATPGATPAATSAATQASAPSSLSAPAASPQPAAPAPAQPTAASYLQSTAPQIADIDHPPTLAPAAPSQAVIADVDGALDDAPAAAANFNLLDVGFDEGSDQVTREATPGLIAFAQSHITKTIQITGYGGDAKLDDAALNLAWRRAKSVAAALAAAGVPMADLRLAAEAPIPSAGRGAELSLLN